MDNEVQQLSGQLRAAAREDHGRRTNHQLFNDVARGEAGTVIGYQAARQMLQRERRVTQPAVPRTAVDATPALDAAAVPARSHHCFSSVVGGDQVCSTSCDDQSSVSTQ